METSNLNKAIKEVRELRKHDEFLIKEENKNLAIVDAAYAYVESVKHTADDRKRLMWFGWALRFAFIAGVEWQKNNKSN